MFRFKQFSVAHDKCAMKVNTDGVLLGAWAVVSDANSILDIGTGTGVIALMLAQKNATAQVDAIDIDENAYVQAKGNFIQSPWANRLTAYHTPLQSFEPLTQYDIIVSNPPYFIDDFKSGKAQKDIARHSIALTYNELLGRVGALLTENGRAFIVIPLFNLEQFVVIAGSFGLGVSRVTEVTAVEGKAPYLALVQLQKVEQQLINDTLCIQDSSGNFTQAYKHLTKDFYLKF